jgi:hypothetical protein
MCIYQQNNIPSALNGFWKSPVTTFQESLLRTAMYLGAGRGMINPLQASIMS